MSGKFDKMNERLESFGQSLDKKPKGGARNLSFRVVPLEQLKTAPWNARRYFDPESIQRLGWDMAENGQIHPILVRFKDEFLEIVVGERRYRAAQALGWTEMKVELRSLDDHEAQRISLAENLSREDLNPYEETMGYLQLLFLELSDLPEFKQFQQEKESKVSTVARLLRRYANEVERAENNVILTDAQVRGTPLGTAILTVFSDSQKMTWQSFVKNRLPLMNMPKDVRVELQAGKLDYTKAKKIAQLKDDAVRQSLLQESINQNLPLTEISNRVKAAKTMSKNAPAQLEQLSFRAQQVSKALKKSLALNHKVKAKKAERLLQELEDLLGISETATKSA